VQTVGQLCISFTLFNLLPLPLLTAGHILVAILPQQRETLRRTQPYIAVVLALLIVSGSVARLFAPAEAVISHVLLGE
jgi:Zn-dependent protease